MHPVRLQHNGLHARGLRASTKSKLLRPVRKDGMRWESPAPSLQGGDSDVRPEDLPIYIKNMGVPYFHVVILVIVPRAVIAHPAGGQGIHGVLQSWDKWEFPELRRDEVPGNMVWQRR